MSVLTLYPFQEHAMPDNPHTLRDGHARRGADGRISHFTWQLGAATP
jgi:hypothetical protein